MRNNKGFTLIEIMIVVAILAVLAAIAIPNYQKYVLRSHRVEARNMLQDIAQRMEQGFSVNRVYNSAPFSDITAANAQLATWGLNRSPASGTTRYNISFTNLSATTFTVQAVPTGPQIADTECGSFSLDNRNVKTANGKKGRDPTSVSCWTR